MAWPKGMKRNRDLRPEGETQGAVAPAVGVELADAAEGSPVIETQKAEAAGPVNKGKKFPAYTGAGSLPPFTYKHKRLVLGSPRYSVARVGRKYKLLAYNKKPSGIVRKLVCVINPTPKRPGDVALLQRLKNEGVPGAF